MFPEISANGCTIVGGTVADTTAAPPHAELARDALRVDLSRERLYFWRPV